jgi:hypothetical protein
MYSNRDTTIEVDRAIGVAPARGLGGIPVLALCCLLFLLLVIASTIVLALIPVYVSASQATQGGTSKSYSATADYSGSPVNDGSLDSNAKTSLGNSMATGLGVPNGGVNVKSATFATSSGRRRRRALSHRNRRISINGLIQLLYIIFVFVRSVCGSCITIASNIAINFAVSFVYGGILFARTLSVTIFSTAVISVPATLASSTTSTTTSTSTSTTSTTSTAATTTGLVPG